MAYDHTRFLFLPEHRQTPGRRVRLGMAAKCVVPGYVDFTLGTCRGALRAGPTAYQLLAITNSARGNGDFGRLMRHLLALGRAHGRDLIVLDIGPDYLWTHLRRVYGMRPVGTTRHLLRQVGGPGTCPGEFLTSEDHPVLDALLCVLTNMV